MPFEGCIGKNQDNSLLIIEGIPFVYHNLRSCTQFWESHHQIKIALLQGTNWAIQMPLKNLMRNWKFKHKVSSTLKYLKITYTKCTPKIFDSRYWPRYFFLTNVNEIIKINPVGKSLLFYSSSLSTPLWLKLDIMEFLSAEQCDKEKLWKKIYQSRPWQENHFILAFAQRWHFYSKGKLKQPLSSN